jgi:thiamine kinase-like enzyme
MQIEKCFEEIENEIELIDELIVSHKQLLDKVETSIPNRIEISALATVLHSFYNGVENIFSRIANLFLGHCDLEFENF